MKRPVFASNLLEHCAMKEKLKSATGKLYKTLAQFDVDKVNAFGVHLVQSETRVIWDNQITELNECNCDQIVYLLNQYILPKAANEDKLHLMHEQRMIQEAIERENYGFRVYLRSIQAHHHGSFDTMPNPIWFDHSFPDKPP
eukprot:65551_1